MPITLHRFKISHFSEKARAALDFKGLDYTLVDHVAGPGQLAIYRLSGQRKLPLLEHEGAVVHDSTAIALYLEHAFPAGRGGARARKVGIVALARKLLVELWRFLEHGVIPDGAELKAYV